MFTAQEHSGESKLEFIIVLHLALLGLFAPWAQGGNVAWSRTAICWWGSLGGVLTLAALVKAGARGGRKAASWLWPFALLNLLVLASATNPSLRPIGFDQEQMFLPVSTSALRPSTSNPGVTLHALWLFDVIYLSCFNLLLVVRRRRTLRLLLTTLAVNAVILAVFGTFQKLTHARGIFFGAIASPQPAFFASFIYHNHWGAYAVLMLAAATGLVYTFARDSRYRNFWHSPAPGLLLGTLLLALSVPLSTSRSCTVLVLMLTAGLAVYWLRSRVSSSGQLMGYVSPTRLLPALLLIGIIFAGYELARPTIDQRLATTSDQIAELRARGNFGSRQELYRDTWHMARDQLAFGWGLGSYPLIFSSRYNTQQSLGDGLPVFYYDAHSDWLQSLAEVGLTGTIACGLLAVVPLIALWKRTEIRVLSGILFGGCALILIYAWVEFPFGNPAVVLSWWLCFFSGIQLARLEFRSRS